MLESSEVREEAGARWLLRIEELEKRVERLEASAAGAEDTQALEERIARKLAERDLAAGSAPIPSATIFEATKRLLPAALGGRKKPAGATSQRGWLIPELYAELRAMFWMFLDTRYRLGWTCRLLPPLFISMVFISWFLLDGRLFYVGTLIDRTIEVILVVVSYKILSREAQRYRETVPDFPSKHAA